MAPNARNPTGATTDEHNMVHARICMHAFFISITKSIHEIAVDVIIASRLGPASGYPCNANEWKFQVARIC